MTTFLDKLKNRMADAKAAAIEFEERIKAMTVPAEIKDERMAICNSCEFLFTPTMNCKKCGCFVWTKTSMYHTKCPIDKWNIVVIKDT
jgi:hypothetical protein